jgi:o-succinylbenzoate synthase
MSEHPIKVERAILRHVKVPMREPFRISNGAVSEKESIVIELHTAQHVGYGEASPMSGSFYSSETPETTWQALAVDLIPDLLSRTLRNPVEYAEILNDYKREPFARAGVEGAVWDLQARQLNTSIAALFGTVRKPIESGLAVGIYNTTQELLERIALYLRDEYKRVKIKIMPGWDVAPLEAVRARFGDIPLMVDANAAYDLRDHRELLVSLDRFNLMMIEQPLAATALDDMSDLSRSVKTPICVDESADSMEALEAIIANDAAKIVNIKVQRVGSLWNAVQMLKCAKSAGLACWLGTMPELGIASAQALEIASLDGFVYPTDIEASERWFVDDIIRPHIRVANGIIDIPQEGFAVDANALEHFTITKQEFSL